MRSFLRSDAGATGGEYALLLALLASGVALAVMGLGDKMSGAMDKASAILAEAGLKPAAVAPSADPGSGAAAAKGHSNDKGNKGSGLGNGGGAGTNPGKGH